MVQQNIEGYQGVDTQISSQKRKAIVRREINRLSMSCLSINTYLVTIVTGSQSTTTTTVMMTSHDNDRSHRIMWLCTPKYAFEPD